MHNILVWMVNMVKCIMHYSQSLQKHDFSSRGPVKSFPSSWNGAHLSMDSREQLLYYGAHLSMDSRELLLYYRAHLSMDSRELLLYYRAHLSMDSVVQLLYLKIIYSVYCKSWSAVKCSKVVPSWILFINYTGNLLKISFELAIYKSLSFTIN